MKSNLEDVTDVNFDVNKLSNHLIIDFQCLVQ